MIGCRFWAAGKLVFILGQEPAEFQEEMRRGTPEIEPVEVDGLPAWLTRPS